MLSGGKATLSDYDFFKQNAPPFFFLCIFLGKPVMIVIEYMENGALDAFLRVSARGGHI